MRFRMLTDEELKELENEFKHYLVSNDISSEEWININENTPDKAIDLVEKFSEIVFEKSLEKIDCIEHVSKNSFKIFHCEDDKMSLIALDIAKDSDFDLSTKDGLQALIQSDEEISVYTAEKEYSPSKADELFKMLNQGCSVANLELYESIKNGIITSEE